MKLKLYTLIAPFILILLIASRQTGTAETLGPEIVNIGFTPDTINASSTSQVVTVTAEVADPILGVEGITCDFTGPFNIPYAVTMSLVGGTPQDAIYTGTFQLETECAVSGTETFTLGPVTVTDYCGYASEYTAAASDETLAFPGQPNTVLTVTGTGSPPPQLQRISFTPSTASTSSPSPQITVTAVATAQNPGVSYIDCTFQDAAGQSLDCTLFSFDLTGGTVTDGTFSGTISLNQCQQAGTYTLTSVVVNTDCNSQAYAPTASPGILAYPGNPNTQLIISNPIQPPQLLGIGFTPTSLDVSSGSSELVVTATAAASAGIESVDCTFIGPDGQFFFLFMDDSYIVSGGASDGVFTGYEQFGSCQYPGTYTLGSVEVIDMCGNSASYAPAASPGIQAYPGAPNVTLVLTNTNSFAGEAAPAPTITGFNFTPTSIDLSNTSSVTIMVTITGSNLDTCSFGFVSTSGSEIDGSAAASTPSFGTPQTLQTTITLYPCSTQAGSWQLKYLTAISPTLDYPCNSTASTVTYTGTNPPPGTPQTSFNVTNPDGNGMGPVLYSLGLSSTTYDVGSDGAYLSGTAIVSTNMIDGSGVYTGTSGATVTFDIGFPNGQVSYVDGDISVCTPPGIYTLTSVTMLDTCFNYSYYGPTSPEIPFPAGVPTQILITSGTPTTGSLTVDLYPSVEAQDNYWFLDGSSSYQYYSGQTYEDLAPGTHTVSFTSTDPSYTPPNPVQVTVTAGETAFVSGTYMAPGDAVEVAILPSEAATIGAKWNIDNGPLEASGATVEGLADGQHLIQFSGVNGFTTPAPQTITTSGGQTTVTTGTYLAVSSSGSLLVNIQPPGAVTAGAQWEVDGGSPETSGSTVTGLTVGSHTVSFTTATGYTAPSPELVTVAANQTTVTTGTYTLQTGSLQVTLTPAGAVTAGAQWEVDGGSPETSGSTVTGLSVGSHTVSFTTATGYTAPSPELITVAANQTTVTTGTYTLQTGSLQVNLTPAGAVTAGARWEVDGGSPETSGSTVTGLTVGSHTLSFTGASGYSAPSPVQVSVAANQTTATTGTYTATAETGSLQVTLTPAGAVSAGAQWEVDGGSPEASGGTVTGLSIGSHTISFTAATGYTAPTTETVSVAVNQTTFVTGTYTAVPQTGSVQVILTPAGAVSAGAQWEVDGGSSEASGSTVTGLSVGSHTVSFTGASGYSAPNPVQVSVAANQTTDVTGTYTATAETGSLQVTLTPAGAVSAGAQWEVDGGSPEASGSSVTGLSIGNHIVSFTTAAGYTPPSSETVQVISNETTMVTGTYVAASSTTGSVTVTLLPAGDASFEGADWCVDGGAIQSSGATVSNLIPGNHIVSYFYVFGYVQPVPQVVSVSAGQDLAVTGTYTVPVNITPYPGSYYALLSNTSGYVSITVAKSGKFTGKLIFGNATTSLAGRFSSTGGYLTDHPFGSLGLQLGGTQATPGANYIYGGLAGSLGNASFVAYHAAYGKGNPAPEVGVSTLEINEPESVTGVPTESAGATLTVRGNGDCKFSGLLLGEGKFLNLTRFSQSGVLTGGPAGDQFIIYELLTYSKPTVKGTKGSLAGAITFSGNTPSGELLWTVPSLDEGLVPGFQAVGLSVAPP